MTIADIDASDDQCQYVGQVYEEQYARLRRYFLRQLGDGPEADECARETVRRLFFFMEDRDWEAESEYIPVYIMRIAGLLCSRRLRERGSRRPGEGGHDGFFNGIGAVAVAAVMERVGLARLLLRPAAGGGHHPGV